jgi:peptide/nickel transport system substrate-binding protein
MSEEIRLAGVTRRQMLVRSGMLLGAAGILGSWEAVLAACQSGTPNTTTQGGRFSKLGPVDSVVMLDDDIPAGLDGEGPGTALTITQFGIDQCYSNLVRYELAQNSEGVLIPDYTKLIGDLAESFTQEGLTWTFKLRHGVISAAGNEMTADDVVFTFARAKSVSGASLVGWFLLNTASIFDAKPAAKNATAADKQLNGEVVKIDKYTVQIKQLQANRLFPAVIELYPFPVFDSVEIKKHVTDIDPWGHTYINSVGTAGFGPYFVKSWTKDSEIVFQANPNWTAPGLIKPYIKTVTVKKVPSTSVRLSSIETGQADIIENMTSRDWDALKKSNKVVVYGAVGNGNTYMSLNFKIAPFDNIKLRQAIAYAIPYKAIIDTVYFGQARPWYSLVPDTYPGYKEIKIYSTDVAKAKQLLADAGFPNGQGLEKYPDAFTLYYAAENQAQLQPLATQIVTGLDAIGIKVQLNPIPQVEYGRRQQITRDLAMALSDRSKPVVPDGGYAVTLYFVTTGKGGISNYSNYSNPEVDDLWNNQAKNEPDDTKRSALLGKIQDILMRDLPHIPIALTRNQVAVSPTLAGYSLRPDQAIQLKYFGKKI